MVRLGATFHTHAARAPQALRRGGTREAIMTGFNTVVRHLEQLRLYLDRVAELQQYSREALLRDWHVQTMVERTLQLAIEAVISISEQIIASLSLATPESSRAALGTLADAGVLQRDLAIELQQA